MDAEPPAAYRPVMAAWTVTVAWSALQPTHGGPIAADNPIDKAITTVNALAAQTPAAHLVLRVRIGGGVQAPAWAKTLGGAAIPYRGLPRGADTIGRFWTAAYGAAYQQFQNELAAKYDLAPQIAEVEINRCGTDTDQPFVLNANLPGNAAALTAAGYTPAAGQACETAQIDESRAWTHTHLDLDISPYLETVTGTGTTSSDNRTDTTTPTTVITYCRRTLGTRCVLENNAFQAPEPNTKFSGLDKKFQAAGAPISYQTVIANGKRHTLTGPTLLTTLAGAVTLGANSVELHEGKTPFEQLDTPTQLAPYNTKLANNPTTQ